MLKGETSNCQESNVDKVDQYMTTFQSGKYCCSASWFQVALFVALQNQAERIINQLGRI